jgi:hypothetical protein
MLVDVPCNGDSGPTAPPFIGEYTTSYVRARPPWWGLSNGELHRLNDITLTD